MSDTFNTYPNPVCAAFIKAIEAKMPKQTGIPITGVKLDKDGKLIKRPSRMSVSKRIAQGKSKKVRPTKRVTGSFNKP